MKNSINFLGLEFLLAVSIGCIGAGMMLAGVAASVMSPKLSPTMSAMVNVVDVGTMVMASVEDGDPVEDDGEEVTMTFLDDTLVAADDLRLARTGLRDSGG